MPLDSDVRTPSQKRAPGFGAPMMIIRTGAAGQPTLQVTTTANYDWLYSDAGSGSSMDVTIFRPRPTDSSYSIIGDYAQGNYAPPVGASLVVRAINDDPHNPLLRPPTDFRQIWNDQGSGGDHDGSIWYPVPPDGYIALGYVAQAGYSKPSIPNFACLRRDLVVQTDAGSLVWSDKNSGAHGDVSLYMIVGVANAFVGQPNYSPFSGTAYKLKTT